MPLKTPRNRRSVMLNRPFPDDDSAESRKIARNLCMRDALIASLVILLVLMVIDQAGQDVSPWWWYVTLWAILYLVECMVNWRRYRAPFKKRKS